MHQELSTQRARVDTPDPYAHHHLCHVISAHANLVPCPSQTNASFSWSRSRSVVSGFYSPNLFFIHPIWRLEFPGIHVVAQGFVLCFRILFFLHHIVGILLLDVGLYRARVEGIVRQFSKQKPP